MFEKRLSKLDIKSIVLMLDDFNRTHSDLTNNQKEYFLANTLAEFGIKSESEYTYGCIPCPPQRDSCYQPTKDVTTKPPTEE